MVRLADIQWEEDTGPAPRQSIDLSNIKWEAVRSPAAPAKVLENFSRAGGANLSANFQPQPWQQTLQEYARAVPPSARKNVWPAHQAAVRHAVFQGETVPIPVLEEYAGQPWANQALESARASAPALGRDFAPAASQRLRGRPQPFEQGSIVGAGIIQPRIMLGDDPVDLHRVALESERLRLARWADAYIARAEARQRHGST